MEVLEYPLTRSPYSTTRTEYICPLSLWVMGLAGSVITQTQNF